MNDAGRMRKTYLVTGATGAIGKAIAAQIAAQGECRVVILGRNEEKSAQAVREIVRRSDNPDVHFVLADLSRWAEITMLAESWKGSLHCLINNASIAPRRRLETPEGIELQFATNVLGYYRMMVAFEPFLKAAVPARVVNVASYWAGGLDLGDLEFKVRRYDNDAAYRQSKQAERMLTAVFAKRWEKTGIAVNVCHPGDVNSQLSNDLGFGGHETPDEGAATPVWLATQAIGEDVSGGYFEHKKQVACPFMRNWQAAERLFDICAGYATGLEE